MGHKRGAARRFRRLARASIAGVEVPVVAGFASRLLGLALLPRGRAGPGLLLPGCRSVHTFGMRFRLDLVFLGAEGETIEVRRSVPRGRIARCARAVAVLELPAGSGHGDSAVHSRADR
jgi:uncharacterized membrane protein (UPF0127 family)